MRDDRKMKTLEDKKIKAYVTSDINVQLDEDITGIMVIPFEDVKEAVLEFENRILDRDPNLVEEESNWITLKIFKEIFGDVEK